MSFPIPSRATGVAMISTLPASSASHAVRRDAADADLAKCQFEAMILQSAFAPVASALGFYGDLVLAPVMRSILRAESR